MPRGGAEFSRGPERGVCVRFGSPVILGAFLAIVALVKANGGLQDKEDIIPGALNFADGFGDTVVLRERVVDRISQFLHQVFQWLVHKDLPPLWWDAPPTRLVAISG